MARYFNYTDPQNTPTRSATSTGDQIVTGGYMTPTINLSGVDSRSGAEVDAALRAYNKDVYNDIKYYKTEKHPMLTLIASGAKPVDMTEFVVSETYEDEEYFDLHLDQLRVRKGQRDDTNKTYDYYTDRGLTDETANQYLAPYRINEAAYADAGKLNWYALGTGALTGLNSAVATATTLADDIEVVASVGTSQALSDHSVLGAATLALAWKIDSDNPAQGTPYSLVEKLRSLLLFAGYKWTKTLTQAGAAAGQVFVGLYKTDKSTPVKFMFDNIAINTGSARQFVGVVAHITSFWFNADDSRFVITIDMADSTVSDELHATADSNTVQLVEFNPVGTDGNTLYGVTYISPVVMLGGWGEFTEGVPEGSRSRDGESIKRNFGSKTNFVQIFRSKSWSMTGSRYAHKSPRFIDDWKDTRDRYMKVYKDSITTGLLFNTKAINKALNPETGKYETVRHTGGLLDRQTWNIRYFRADSLAQSGYSTALEASTELFDWVEGLAEAHTAFMTDKKSKTITIAVSSEMIRSLRRVAALAQGYGQNLFGQTNTGNVQKGTMDLGFDVTTFNTAYGKVNFVEEPAFSFMPSMALPYQLTGGAKITPKKIGLMLDLPSVVMRTYRPDKLQGNLMLPDEDIALKEDLIGEHGLEVTKPRHQSLIIFE